LSSDWVWAINEDQRGSIWLGTLGRGLNRLEPTTGHVTRYRHDPQNPTSLSEDNISTIHIDRSGVIWVGTYGGGLDRFDPERDTFTHYRERDGLASDRIVSILEDGDAGDAAAGNLWIATGRGLSKLDRDRKTFHAYGTIDGLPLPEYNRGRYKTHSGELLLSSMHGLIAFDPAAVRDDADVPPVVFTNFLLANTPSVHAHCRNPQIRHDAGTECAKHRRAGPLRHPPRACRALRKFFLQLVPFGHNGQPSTGLDRWGSMA
jgi:hypothetical protein